MNSKALFQELISSITLDESRDEIRTMAYLVLEKVLGLTKTDIITEKPVAITQAIQEQLDDIVKRLNAHEPLHYITGECHFFGRTFAVNRHVLIPRPETEELVSAALDFVRTKKEKIRILDIGTGSGCIAITLALEIPTAHVLATDISNDALALAKTNAQNLKAPVTFINHDILTGTAPFETLDIVVSNPPYITITEKAQMKKNVLDYEPHLALFVPQNDSLVFHRTIATVASQILNKGGLLAVEINEQLGQAVTDVLRRHSFKSVRMIKDLAGKERIVSGIKP